MQHPSLSKRVGTYLKMLGYVSAGLPEHPVAGMPVPVKHLHKTGSPTIASWNRSY
jgi:hypothetical protein